MTRSLKTPAMYRWQVASRVLAAFGGGYVLTSLVAANAALLLPRLSSATQAESVLMATMCSFVLYACIILWAFATSSASRAWLGIGTASALAGMGLVLLKSGG